MLLLFEAGGNIGGLFAFNNDHAEEENISYC